MRHLRAIVILLVTGMFCGLGGGAAQAQTRSSAAVPPAPWPGPQGAFLFIEAEAFSPEGKGWSVVQAARNRFDDQVASAGAALGGAGAGDGTAAWRGELPAPGTYRLFVRFTEPRLAGAQQARAPFRLRLEQGGRTVAEPVFGDDPQGAGGRRNGFAWNQAETAVTLEAGDLGLVLEKVGPARAADSDLRKVDCILLVADEAYEPDYRDFGPQMYLRFRLESADPESVYFYCFVNHTRSPWYQNTAFFKGGWIPSVRPPEDKYLTAGESTGWTNVSRLNYYGTDSIYKVQATVKYHNPDASHSSYAMDFATAPDEAHIVKTVQRSGPGAGMQVRVPSDFLDGKMPRADYEYAAEMADQVAQMPAIEFGRTPELFPMSTGIGAGPGRNAPGTREAELDAVAYMGLNGIRGKLSETYHDAGLRFGTLHSRIWYRGPAGFAEPNLEKIEEGIKRAAAELEASPYPDSFLHNMLMDEATAMSLEALASHERVQTIFAQWLSEEPGAPVIADGKLADGTPVRIEPDRNGHPVLYYWSQRYRAWNIARFFQQCTELARKYMPSGPGTAQNFSDGAVWMANFFRQGNDYYTWYRNRALDIAYSEDWTNQGATHQLAGWNVALLRSATKYHNQPIQMFCITSYGRTPLTVKLKAMTDIAQGAKSLSFFAWSPEYAGHEVGWAGRWAMYPAIAEVTREVGAAEHLLMDAMPKPARTAILYSVPADIWGVGYDNTLLHERMFTYLALRHAQRAVDVVSDQDILEGRLQPYETAYLSGRHFDPALAAPLAAWVRGGGTLVLLPGAASMDLYNQPTTALDEALGIERGEVEALQPIEHASLYVCRLAKPTGLVTLLGPDGQTTGTTDLLSWRQTFPGPGRVTATDDQGQTVGKVVDVGSGKVRLVGYLPGFAYMREARLAYEQVADEPVQPLWVSATVIAADAEADEDKGEAGAENEEANEEDGESSADSAEGAAGVTVPRRRHVAFPTAYPQALRDFIVAPTDGLTQPVTCDVPMVEATLLQGRQGFVVPLGNWSGKPIEKLTVTLTLDRAVAAIHSSREGELAIARTDAGGLTVTLPLESTDMLYGTWE